MKRVVALLLFAWAMQAQNTNNDSSCDISVAPAATLLLPYFEVETATRGRTTLFSVTNVSSLPQAVHATLWTDYGYPALTFNLYLTPYDVQAINLYDVILNGVIDSGSGPASSGCGNLPRFIPLPLLNDVRAALISGMPSSCSNLAIGGKHGTLAVGYLTLDVVRDCTPALATSEAYFRDELRFDNVLIGDAEIVDPDSRAAGGTPLVHIRAVPEGGPSGAPAVPTPLQWTFYTRYLGGLPAGFDRRQPLPSMFTARYIQGGVSSFHTQLRIWREGTRGALSTCAGYLGSNVNAVTPTQLTAGNSFMPSTEVVRFDEHGQPMYFTANCDPCFIRQPLMPETSSVPTSGPTFPPLASVTGDVGGWIYLNLNSGLVEGPSRPSQNWVSVSMSLTGLFTTDFDAASMGNGCTPAVPTTYANTAGLINPAGWVPVCPDNSRPEVCQPGVKPYIGTNKKP